MNYNEAYEELKNNGIYLKQRDGELTIKYKRNLYGSGYLKGVKLLLKENPKLKAEFLKVIRSEK